MFFALLTLHFCFPDKARRMKIVTRVGQNGFDESDSGGMRWIGVLFLFLFFLLGRSYNRMVKFMNSEAKFLRSFSSFSHVLIYNKHLISNSISVSTCREPNL